MGRGGRGGPPVRWFVICAYFICNGPPAAHAAACAPTRARLRGCRRPGAARRPVARARARAGDAGAEKRDWPRGARGGRRAPAQMGPPPPARARGEAPHTGTRRRAPVRRGTSGGGATKRKARQPLNWPTTSRGRRSMSMGPSTTPSNILNRNNIVMRHHRETLHRARSRRDHTREGLVRRCGRRRRCPRRWQCPWRSALVAVGSTLRAAVSRAAP